VYNCVCILLSSFDQFVKQECSKKSGYLTYRSGSLLQSRGGSKFVCQSAYLSIPMRQATLYLYRWEQYRKLKSVVCDKILRKLLRSSKALLVAQWIENIS
jgi:hypothetical protein